MSLTRLAKAIKTSHAKILAGLGALTTLPTALAQQISSTADTFSSSSSFEIFSTALTGVNNGTNNITHDDPQWGMLDYIPVAGTAVLAIGVCIAIACHYRATKAVARAEKQGLLDLDHRPSDARSDATAVDLDARYPGIYGSNAETPTPTGHASDPIDMETSGHQSDAPEEHQEEHQEEGRDRSRSPSR